MITAIFRTQGPGGKLTGKYMIFDTLEDLYALAKDNDISDQEKDSWVYRRSMRSPHGARRPPTTFVLNGHLPVTDPRHERLPTFWFWRDEWEERERWIAAPPPPLAQAAEAVLAGWKDGAPMAPLLDVLEAALRARERKT